MRVEFQTRCIFALLQATLQKWMHERQQEDNNKQANPDVLTFDQFCSVTEKAVGASVAGFASQPGKIIALVSLVSGFPTTVFAITTFVGFSH